MAAGAADRARAAGKRIESMGADDSDARDDTQPENKENPPEKE